MNDPVLTAMIVASFAAPLPTLAGSTAGGTWDCVAMDGAPIGTVILSDKTYAVVKLDGLVGSYGKLMQVGPKVLLLRLAAIVELLVSLRICLLVVGCITDLRNCLLERSQACLDRQECDRSGLRLYVHVRFLHALYAFKRIGNRFCAGPTLG